ncbi:hypothetical protein MUO79_07665 [Candidatus Bathyarchaeota archaeon]|nr:hypothetical protein [Candidatus Bathyarchaeota archaeon]
MSVRTIGTPAFAGGNLATGTYTGDGAATQAIVGVGFRPRFVQIYDHLNPNDVFTSLPWKTSSDATETWFIPVIGANNYRYENDQIISLDADGFTVGDGTPFLNELNVLGREYTYVCVG